MKKKGDENSKAPCKICLDDLGTKAITVINDCGHAFHAECLGKFSKMKVENRELPIRCPEPDCKMELRIDDLEEILDKKTMEKFREFALKNYLDHHSDEVSWCPTANCPFVFVNDDGITDFLCPVCKKRYCFACRVPFHSGQTCKEYQINNKHSKDDDKFLNLVKSRKFKQCPQCKYWIEKTQGCNSMACRCGIVFCYGCGGSPCKCRGKHPIINRRPINFDPGYDGVEEYVRPRPRAQVYRRPDLLPPDDDYYSEYASYRKYFEK